MQNLVFRPFSSATSSGNLPMIDHLNAESDNKTLYLILDASSDPILITSPEVKIVYVNSAWEKLTGYTFAEVAGKNPRILQSGKTPKEIYQKMWQALKKQQSFTNYEVIDKRKDGTEFNVRSTIYPVVQNDKVIHYVQIMYDITKEKQLEELQKEFIAVVGHELKTPITVLKLLSQLHIAKAKKSGASLMSLTDLELLGSELDRLSRLINDVLDSSRIETGRLHMKFEIQDISGLIKNVVEKMTIINANHKIVVRTIPNASVIGDRERLEQVLINLISNAYKYSPENSTVTISAQIIRKNVVVSITDEGIGIPKKDQPHIFDRFYQVRKKSRIGFGLGLYISNDIIRRHKGKIWVKSQTSKGSTFSFSLPIIDPTKAKYKETNRF